MCLFTIYRLGGRISRKKSEILFVLEIMEGKGKEWRDGGECALYGNKKEKKRLKTRSNANFHQFFEKHWK